MSLYQAHRPFPFPSTSMFGLGGARGRHNGGGGARGRRGLGLGRRRSPRHREVSRACGIVGVVLQPGSGGCSNRRLFSPMGRIRQTTLAGHYL